MKPFIVALALLASGCAFNETRVLNAGESFCTSSDPKVCAALFEQMAQLHTPEMEAAINAARIPGRTQ